jgi:pSer/pThr/pTyr-binding forkhead associated (FHA) protein
MVFIMAELIIQSGKLRGKRLILPDKEVLIGRDEDCHVRLTSSLISRKHCALTSTPEGLWVRDLSSQNGTIVNDVPITEPTLLKPGDVLQLGAILFQVPVQRTVAETAAAKKPEKEGGISDAEIASWLSDESASVAAKSSDTTIIKQPSAPSTEIDVPIERTTPAAPAAAAPVEPTRRPPRSVKEQAAEIIRKHWASVRGEEPKAS